MTTVDISPAAASEWTKLWTVRSTWACLGASAVTAALFCTIDGLTGRSQHAHHDANAQALSVVSSSATGIVYIGQLAIITLATLVIASEYTTTSIRTTLQCVPRRARMLLAKNVVLAPVCLVAGAVVAALGALVAWITMGGYAEPVHTGAVIGLVAKAGGYLGLTAAMVVGLGAVVRSVAGTITVNVLLILMLPMMLSSLDVQALAELAPYLPGGAGQELLGTADAGSYGTAGAVAVLAGWAILANVVGAVVLRARDA